MIYVVVEKNNYKLLLHFPINPPITFFTVIYAPITIYDKYKGILYFQNIKYIYIYLILFKK